MPTQKPSRRGTSGEALQPEPAVVGIGASAGGLNALKSFFAAVPEDSGLAWVVVIHLSPDHESHLADLLQPHVAMPVLQVTESVALEPDRVYVIPPNANLSAVDSHLRLSQLEGASGTRRPIDHFFRTLAGTHRGHAIGVVLSGTGSDGAVGIKTIHEHGGLTIVVAPSEAEYDGMPRSAIATGVVDLVLPLSEIPGAAVRFARTEPRLGPGPADPTRDEVVKRLLTEILEQIRGRTGRDFSYYKHATIVRRLQRRMQMREVEELPAYLDLLREDARELRALADDLLVTVTSFFRDQEVFEGLVRSIIPQLLDARDVDEEVRVWTVGCATGEEAYSLAMLLIEEADRRKQPRRIRVFASDLHERSLEKARRGFYSDDIEANVSATRLKRFFRRKEGRYRVRRELRERVVFAPHDLMRDPPFSRIDLVTCRNLLIYLQREVQKEVIDLFHYALRPQGFLLLGTSETIDASNLFRCVDEDLQVYQKRDIPGPKPHLPVFTVPRSYGMAAVEKRRRRPEPPHPGRLHQRMVERYAPPSLLVSPDGRVVHLSENAGRYLVHAGGEPTSNVCKLVREELRIELQAALHAASLNRQPTRSKPIPVRFNGETRPVVVHVRPAGDPQEEDCVLVIFEEWEAAEEAAAEAADEAAGVDEHRLRELEAELQTTRRHLQATIEEYETSREEMRAQNEEMQSTNEELRSMMEELETSKEELQSMNEELQTVNQENRHKVEELSLLSTDLHNLLAATDIATLFVDRDLRILRFTPGAARLFNVRAVDRGRPLNELAHRLVYDDLHEDARKVLRSLVPTEREVRSKDESTYLARVLPYRSSDDRIAGVVLTFIDVTELRKARDQLAEAKVYAESIVETLHEPLLVLTPDLRVKSVNRAFYDHFGVRKEFTIGRRVYDLGNGQWDIPELRRLLEDVLPDSNVFNDFEVRHVFEDIGERVMLLNARRLDHVQLILLGIRDVTQRRRGEDDLRRSEERFRALVTASTYVVYRMSPDWSELRELDGQGFLMDTVRPSDTWLGDYIPPEDQPEVTATIQEAIRNTEMFELEHRVRRADGTIGWTLSRAVPLIGDDGEILEWFGAASDITARKRSEQEREHERALLDTILDTLPAGIVITDARGRIVRDNEAAREIWGRPLAAESWEDYGDFVGWWPDSGRRIEADEWAMSRALRDGEVTRNELVRNQRGESGEAGYYINNVAPIRDDAGTVVGGVAAMLDVTERAAMEEELRESRAQIQRILDQLPVGVGLLDAEGEWLLRNPTFERLVPGAMPSRDQREAVHWQSWSDDGELLERTDWPGARALRGEAVSRGIDFLHSGHDGGKHWIRVRAAPFLDGNRQVTGAIVVTEDVTARKQAIEALRESESRYRRIVTTANEGIWVIDVEGWTTYVNQKMAAMLGYTVDEMAGASVFDFIYEEDRPAMFESRDQRMQGLQGDFDFRYRRKDGSTLWAHVSTSPILDEEGEFAGAFAMFTDITDRKRAEESLRRMNETLEERVEDRTREVRELASRLTMAEQAERRRISQILHDDLQQMLYGIQMKHLFVRKSVEEGASGEALAELSQADLWLRQCVETTRQLTVDLSPPVLKGEGLTDTVQWLKIQMRDLHALDVEIHAEHSFQIEDEDLRVLIFQVLRELLFNVAKHADVSRAAVELKEEPPGSVLMRVTDRGRGFDVDATETTGSGGGFGLFSVRERIGLFGGDVDVESAPGQGTRVTVRIPRKPKSPTPSTGVT